MTRSNRSVVPKTISPEELLNNLDEYVILDVRRLVEYKAGHIPKALPCSFSNFIKLVGVALYPAEAERIAVLLSELGVQTDTHIILYDNFYGRHAARVAYTLELLGFTEISLLETTFDEYVARKHPITTDKPNITPSPRPSLSYNEQLLIDRDELTRTIAEWNGTTALVDTRDPFDYGYGHIPKAVNIPWHIVHKPSGLFNLDAVRKAAADNNITSDKRLIFYCEEGTSSSLTMYAFRKAGYVNSHTYLASYPDWLNRPK
ncbi:MAG: rhodanese-like domain-containing protein [Candidatus Caldarchaeum sp.]|nr:rhodanese-like domain-containing protein [Candidatus Caldarchaeum sp.]